MTRYFLVLVLASGCGVVDFTIERPIPEQRVSGSLVSGVLGEFFSAPVRLDVDVQAETEARDTGPAKAIYLTTFDLAITDTALASGDADNFDFIDSLDVFVESTQEGSALPRVQVAELDPAPDGATELAVPTFDDVDLLPYAEEGARLTANATGTVPGDDVTYDGRVVLLVEVL